MVIVFCSSYFSHMCPFFHLYCLKITNYKPFAINLCSFRFYCSISCCIVWSLCLFLFLASFFNSCCCCCCCCCGRVVVVVDVIVVVVVYVVVIVVVGVSTVTGAILL